MRAPGASIFYRAGLIEDVVSPRKSSERWFGLKETSMRRLKTGDQALEHCQTGRPSTPQNEPQTRGPVARNLLIGLGAGGRAPSFFFKTARRKITKQAGARRARGGGRRAGGPARRARRARRRGARRRAAVVPRRVLFPASLIGAIPRHRCGTRRFRGRVQAGELRYDGVVALQSALLDASFAAAAPCVPGVLRRGSIASTRRPRRAPAPAFGCARCRHAAGGCLACRPAGVLPPGAPCVSRVL